MTSRLSEFLKTPTLERTAEDYEAVFDDFVQRSGGHRIADRFAVPPATLNADYWWDLDGFELILELKQLSVYDKLKSVENYWQDRFTEGKITRYTSISADKIRIGPESLTKRDWIAFYKGFRPAVSTDLKKAARQLKETDRFLPSSSKRRVKGVMLLNTGDYNLPTDLLARLIEWKMKREWHDGHFRWLDFVSCATVDLVRRGQHPFHSRHIVRSHADELVVEATRFVFEKWTQYQAAALGVALLPAGVELTTTVDAADLASPFEGKIQRKAG